MHQCIKLFYFGMILYMFRSFRTSSRVQDCTYSKQHAYVKQILLSACCRVLSSKQTAVSVWLLYVQSWTPDDGRKDLPKHVECHSKIKQIWYIGVSFWFYYRNNIMIHGSMNVKSGTELSHLQSVEYISSWQANGFPASRGILPTLWNPKIP